MSVGPLIRSGDVVVLTVQTTLDPAAGGGAVVSRHFSAVLSTTFDAPRLVDEGGRRVYLVSKRRAGGGCVCTGRLRVEPGETWPMQAAFGGVPEDVDRLSVMLPYAGVFTDVPVVGGTVPVPPAGPSAGGRVQGALDLSDVAPRMLRRLTHIRSGLMSGFVLGGRRGGSTSIWITTCCSALTVRSSRSAPPEPSPRRRPRSPQAGLGR
nr:hypothetical protein GCM10020092_048790 [Actinoplanes digitatis]